MVSRIVLEKTLFHSKIMIVMERRKLVNKKKQADKPQRKKYFDQPQDQIAYILTDTKETIVTENYYQPISLSILKQYLPEGMC
jgi:hypothetical protein